MVWKWVVAYSLVELLPEEEEVAVVVPSRPSQPWVCKSHHLLLHLLVLYCTWWELFKATELRSRVSILNSDLAPRLGSGRVASSSSSSRTYCFPIYFLSSVAEITHAVTCWWVSSRNITHFKSPPKDARQNRAYLPRIHILFSLLTLMKILPLHSDSQPLLHWNTTAAAGAEAVEWASPQRTPPLQKDSSAHLFSSMICASSSGVKSFSMLKNLRISGIVRFFMRLATFAQESSKRGLISR